MFKEPSRVLEIQTDEGIKIDPFTVNSSQQEVINKKEEPEKEEEKE